ncbi:MAG TPA: helix-turn-helix transcriptional regulator [Trebonia sp.]
MEGEHLLDAVTLVRYPAEIAQVLLAGGNVAGQVGDSPLTARESLIASMAAIGYANQEIADRLFITTHTVEYHLKKVFRKLGIVSRRRLRDKVSSKPS